MPLHVLVLDRFHGVGPWVRESIATAGIAATCAGDVGEALRSVESLRPDVVVVAVGEVNAWEAVLRRIAADPIQVPVLGVASRDGALDLTLALTLGVTDLVMVPCSPEQFAARVRDAAQGPVDLPVADHAEPAAQLAELLATTRAAEQALLRLQAAEARAESPAVLDQFRKARGSLTHALEVILGTMIGAQEAGPSGRPGHARMVASVAGAMSEALGWKGEQVQAMRTAGLFGDIGMLSFPPGLLAPPGPLTPDAQRLLRSHADASADILEPLARVGVPVAAVRSHHERVDGSGYPRGLRGRHVPLGAQVLGVADEYAALVRARPHRPAKTREDALLVLDDEVDLGRQSERVVGVLREVVLDSAPQNVDLGAS